MSRTTTRACGISRTLELITLPPLCLSSLRRRFEQNQTDCTFTVLALLPTATENILKALPVEELTNELQQKRAARLSKLSAGEPTGSEMSSGSPSMTEEDGRSLASFRSDSFVHASQAGESTAEGEGQKTRSRTQLWNELKINCELRRTCLNMHCPIADYWTALTRSFTLLYTVSLLTLLTRIQLNLLGRRNYLSSVVSLASQPQNASTISLEDDEGIEHAFGNDFETNRRYLTFSWWLLHRGWKDLMEKVKEAVTDVFGAVNPREDMSHERLSELTLAVRKNVEGSTSDERQYDFYPFRRLLASCILTVTGRLTKWLPYIMPPRDLEDYVLQESGVLPASETSVHGGSNLRHLLDETSDLIDSPSFAHILSLLNNEAFSHLIDNKCAAEAFKTPPSQPATQQAEPSPNPEGFSSDVTITPAIKAPQPKKAKLATVLAVVSRQAQSIGNGANPPNEYLAAMEQGVRELEAFAAVVYSSNFDLESSERRTGVEQPGPATSNSGNASKLGSEPASRVGESIVDLGESSMAVPPETSGGGVDVGFEKAWGKAVVEESS